MGKSHIAIVFLFIILVLVTLLLNVEKNKKRDTKEIGKQLKLGILLNVIHMCMLFSSEEALLQLLYSLELMVQSWILYYFVRYASAQNRFVKENQEKYRTGAYIVLAIDNIMLLVNAFTEWFFPIRVEQWGDEIITGAVITPIYVVQLLLFAFCEIMIVIIMLHKAHRVSNIYRTKYMIS